MGVLRGFNRFLPECRQSVAKYPRQKRSFVFSAEKGPEGLQLDLGAHPSEKNKKYKNK